MIQYDTAKIYGLTGYFLPNIKYIMNPFLPHDNNPKKSMQRYQILNSLLIIHM